MRVTVTVTRHFDMDVERVLNERGFAPPPATASASQKRHWLRETFYELCGFDRDEDHVDGKYVWLTSEDGDTDFDWPEALA